MSNKKFEMSNYPPPEIKQLYKTLSNSKIMRAAYIEQIEILEKLINKKNEIKIYDIWSAFEKAEFNEFDYFSLIRCIEKATYYPQGMKRTSGMKKDQLKKIAKQSKNLLKLIKNDYWLSCTPCIDFFPDDRKRDIEAVLGSNFNKKTLLMYQFLSAPIFENILEGVEKSALQEAEISVSVAQEKPEQAKNIYFIKIIAPFIRDKLGKRNGKIIKILASLYLEADFSKSFIDNHTSRKQAKA